MTLYDHDHVCLKMIMCDFLSQFMTMYGNVCMAMYYAVGLYMRVSDCL